jgi:hypothetical protein
VKASTRSQADRPSQRPAAEADHGVRSAVPAAFVDNRPGSIAQRELADAIHNSPYVVAQRQRLRSLFGAAAQRRGVEDKDPQPEPLAAPRHPVRVAQEMGSSNTSSNAQAPVQRLIGFEVEYQVPTFGAPTQAVVLWDEKAGADKSIERFLFGGLPHATPLGGSAKRGENSFRITSDHRHAVSREPIRAKLAGMGKLDPDTAVDADASSNLEYVTSPVDELAKGSDKIMAPMIDKVADHATTTFGLATQDTVNKLTAPAAGVETGTPEDKLKDWLHDGDFQQLKPTIQEFRSNILDSCYLQATVGILPSAMGALFTNAMKEEDGLHMTEGKFGQIFEAVNNAAAAVGGAVKDHKYIKELQAQKETQVLASISGMIRLLVMYLVGDALSQTEAFPGGTIKNAVPFLVKVDPATISKAGPYGMMFDDVPDEFVTALADQLSQQKELTVKYWRELAPGYAARDREVKDWVVAGGIKNLTAMFLQGKKPPATGAQTGSQLKQLDQMKQLTMSTKDQSGIPLEYRYIKAMPTAAGLKAELQKLVAEAREINLSRVSEDEKVEVEKRVKE